MGKLTTHVLDTALGKPGAGIKVELYRLAGMRAPLRDKTLAASGVTNQDGRCAQPLLEGAAFAAGQYELVFFAGDYFARQGLKAAEPKFLDEVVIRFGISAPDEHYHVPLLLSPYSYSTYRGS